LLLLAWRLLLSFGGVVDVIAIFVCDGCGGGGGGCVCGCGDG
jgi:hypothetical protein